MKKLIQSFLVTAMVVASLMAASPGAMAEERTCRGTLNAITVDNLRVPSGATCTLNGTRVKGTVKVEKNATLKAWTVRVVGNVQGEGAAYVAVGSNSTVGGSVQLVQGGRARIANSRINGQLLFDSNRGLVEARSNKVGDSIQAFQNKGGVSIYSNTIEGNLQCKSNSPAPNGGSNTVGGNKEDQCKNF